VIASGHSFIRFLIGDTSNECDICPDECKSCKDLYSFHGRINVVSTKRYRFEKQNIDNLNLVYREGKYYIDTLSITLLVDNVKEYEKMYFACFDPETDIDSNHALSDHDPRDTYIVEWHIPTGVIWRRIRQNLTYPSEIRFLKGEIEFTLETEPYEKLFKGMQSITMNRKWNRSTMRNTVWN